MKTTNCPECGKPVGDNALQGLCPECMLKVGLGSQPPGTQPLNPADGSPPRFVPPDPARLAAAFPQLDLLELVGVGGMGAVYKARQRNLDRTVALKILPPDTGQGTAFAERFSREARALARLNHPNIVTVHDFGQAGGFYYFLMEFIDGANLRHLLSDQKLPPETALAIVPQICEALQYAHTQGVVHRDIKPENILLDKTGRVKIADFGLAKLTGTATSVSRLTQPREVMGTPHYMAPEQVEHPADVDHRADIFSLGVVFYEMLTGELPLGKFQPPSHRVRVDVRLDEIVLHALEKEPSRRYQHAGQVKTDVETVIGSPATPGQRQGAVPQDYGVDFKTKATLFGLPLVHVTSGIDPATRRPRVARGIIAIGNVAFGVVAFGGMAVGGIACGGVAIGGLAIAGLAAGLLAYGGLALALIAALGGLAIAPIALGGGAIGYLAHGGKGWGVHVLDAMTRDPAACDFFLPWTTTLLKNFRIINLLVLAIMLLIGLGVPVWLQRRLRRQEQARATPPTSPVPDQPSRGGAAAGGLVAFLVVLVVAATVTAWMPRTYRGVARVATAQKQGLFDPYWLQQEHVAITSISNLENVALSLGLAQRPHYGSGKATADEVRQLMRARLMLRQIRSTALTEIDYYAPTRREAADVANGIAEAYCQARASAGARMVDRAEPPLGAIRPNVGLNLAVGALLGLMVGYARYRQLRAGLRWGRTGTAILIVGLMGLAVAWVTRSVHEANREYAQPRPADAPTLVSTWREVDLTPSDYNGDEFHFLDLGAIRLSRAPWPVGLAPDSSLARDDALDGWLRTNHADLFIRFSTRPAGPKGGPVISVLVGGISVVCPPGVGRELRGVDDPRLPGLIQRATRPLWAKTGVIAVWTVGQGELPYSRVCVTESREAYLIHFGNLPGGNGIRLKYVQLSTPGGAKPARAANAGSALFEVRLVVAGPSPEAEGPVGFPYSAETPDLAEPLFLERKVLLDQRDVLRAEMRAVYLSPTNETAGVELLLTEDGKQRFAQTTRAFQGQRLAFLVDGHIVAAPRIAGEIPGGRVTLTSSLSAADARRLVDRLNGLSPSSADQDLRRLIIEPGRHRLPGIILHSVVVATNAQGALNATFLSHNTSSRPEVALRPGWFIYPEGPDRVWLCPGDDTLARFEFRRDMQMIRGVDADPSLAAQIPEILLPHLPAAVRNRLPGQAADVREARAKLAELLVNYAEEHPEARAMRRRIEELERLSREEPNAPADLREAKARLAELRVSYTDEHPLVKQAQARIKALTDSAGNTKP